MAPRTEFESVSSARQAEMMGRATPSGHFQMQYCVPRKAILLIKGFGTFFRDFLISWV